MRHSGNVPLEQHPAAVIGHYKLPLVSLRYYPSERPAAPILTGWEIGERVDAIRWMKRSAVDSRFLPAWIELGVMLAILGANKREVRAGVTYVWVAHKLGHAAALLNI